MKRTVKILLAICFFVPEILFCAEVALPGNLTEGVEMFKEYARTIEDLAQGGSGNIQDREGKKSKRGRHKSHRHGRKGRRKGRRIKRGRKGRRHLRHHHRGRRGRRRGRR